MINQSNNASNQPLSKKIDNYVFKFQDLLGQGNFSKVYKAQHIHTQQIVAIKIVELNSLKSKKLEELLFQQIDILKKLNHPNVLRCHEVFTSNRNCYIITELCNGGDLESKLKSKRRFSEVDAKPIINDIFEGLLYLAEKHIVHRDLKIANIFLHNGKAKIADFGFAKFINTNFKDINIGSPIYMSPEGLLNNIYGPKTDVWAFGILIYQLLHGETPFSMCKTEKQLKHTISIPMSGNQLRKDLHPEIKEVIFKCLEINQAQRITIQKLKNLDYFKAHFEKNIKFEPIGMASLKIIPFDLNSPRKQTIFVDKMFHTGSDFYTGSDLFSPGTTNPNSQSIQQIKNKKDYDLSGKDRVHTLNHNQRDEFSRFERRTQLSPKRGKSTADSAFVWHKTSDKTTQPSLSSGSRIINGQLKFESCVNFLHYCRLLYKHIDLLLKSPSNEEQQINTCKRWLATVLGQLNSKIISKEVLCSGPKGPQRHQKLVDVSSRYLEKYSKGLNFRMELAENKTKATFESMCNYFYTMFQQIDSRTHKDKSPLTFIIGHSIVQILLSTRFLSKCYSYGSYVMLQTNKDVQNFLATSSQQLGEASYMWFRKQLQ